MLISRWTLTAAALLALCVARTASAQELARAAERVHPEVHAVASGGAWTDEGGDGFYRVVVFSGGYEHVTSRVFVQWLKVGEDGYRIVASVPVAEVNDAVGWSVGTPELVHRDNRPMEVRLPATHSHSGEETEFRLRLGRPGRYTLLSSRR